MIKYTKYYPMPQPNIIPIKPSANFTALKGTGPVRHNLHAALTAAAGHSSNPLHALKNHVDAITGVFNKSFVKKSIREGGLSNAEQKLVVKHIFEAKPELAKNAMTNKNIKRLVSNFGKDAAVGVARPHAFVASGPAAGAATVDQIVNKQVRIDPTVNAGRSSAVSTAHVGSIANLTNKKPTG